MTVTEMMRRDWDARARRNAFHYIASWKQKWDLQSFLASGEKDYEALVAPILERCGVRSAGDVMIELGCGAGRMTRSFARRGVRLYPGIPARFAAGWCIFVSIQRERKTDDELARPVCLGRRRCVVVGAAGVAQPGDCQNDGFRSSGCWEKLAWRSDRSSTNRVCGPFGGW